MAADFEVMVRALAGVVAAGGPSAQASEGWPSGGGGGWCVGGAFGTSSPVGMFAAVHMVGRYSGLLGVTGEMQRRPAGGDCGDSE